MNGLTGSQQRRLKHLEGQITKAGGELYEAFRAIHDEKLYLAEHATFDDYCRDRWDMSPRNAYRLLQHGQVLRLVDDAEKQGENGAQAAEKVAMRPIGHTAGEVLKEAHTREVADLPDDQKVEVLTKAVETAPKDKAGKPKVTAKHVRDTRSSKAGGNGRPPASKRKTKEINTAAMVDRVVKRISPAAREMDDIAEHLGWRRKTARTGNHKTANESLCSLLAALKGMKGGEL